MIKSCKQFCFPIKYNYVKIILSECKRRLSIELLCDSKIIIFVKSIGIISYIRIITIKIITTIVKKTCHKLNTL